MPVPQLAKLKPNTFRYKDATTGNKAQANPVWFPQPAIRDLDIWGLKFAPAVKRSEISRPKEKKLVILRYWYYALVPDEKNPDRLRHVRNEDIARYKASFDIECEAWQAS